jgi:hypothetical protein
MARLDETRLDETRLGETRLGEDGRRWDEKSDIGPS